MMKRFSGTDAGKCWRKCGYGVLTAGQGNEGIKLAREHMPDMAFIDLKMPNMSGMEIIEILSRDIPDIVSGHDYGIRDHCISRGGHAERCL